MGKILVTGGTGFIGSHTCVALINAGYQVVIMDNLCNSKVEAIARIEMITGKHVRFYRTYMRDEEDMRQIFEDNKIDAVIHFAGLKAVGESVEKPLEYYENNISGTLSQMCIRDSFKVDEAQVKTASDYAKIPLSVLLENYVDAQGCNFGFL